MKTMLKNPMVRKFGGPVARLAAREYIGDGKPLDIRLGAAMFKEKRVPVISKMSALALGVAAMMAWNLLELPIEALVAFLLPIIGLPIELAWNGLETVLGSLLFASLFLPHVAPRELVTLLRAERAEPVPAPVSVLARTEQPLSR